MNRDNGGYVDIAIGSSDQIYAVKNDGNVYRYEGGGNFSKVELDLEERVEKIAVNRDANGPDAFAVITKDEGKLYIVNRDHKFTSRIGGMHYEVIAF